MAIEQDFSSSWLKNSLLADYWKPREAFVILAGLSWKDDGGPDDEGFDYLGSVEKDGSPDYWNGVREREDIANRLEYYWASQSDDPKPPAFFIEWAISKNQHPEWLDWAIEHGLYTPKRKTEGTAQIEAAPIYSTKWLAIQQATIVQFFNPRRNPDAKREEVVKWIKQQAETAGLPSSNNIATTIFTIIKPANHDPKKKRVEPQ